MWYQPLCILYRSSLRHTSKQLYEDQDLDCNHVQQPSFAMERVNTMIKDAAWNTWILFCLLLILAYVGEVEGYCYLVFLVSSYGASLAHRAFYLALHSSLFGSAGVVNYDYIVTNSINS